MNAKELKNKIHIEVSLLNELIKAVEKNEGGIFNKEEIVERLTRQKGIVMSQ